MIVFVCLSIMAGAGFAFWWFLIRTPEGPAPAPAYEPPPLGEYMLTSPSPAEAPAPADDSPAPAMAPGSPAASPGSPAMAPSPWSPPAAASPIDYGSGVFDPLLCLPDPTLGSFVKAVNFWGAPVDEKSEYKGGMTGVGECCDLAKSKNMKGYVYNSKTGECWTKNMSRAAMADSKTQIMTTGFDDNVVVSFDSTQMPKLTEGTITDWRNKL
jgi:hypothetical protein